MVGDDATPVLLLMELTSFVFGVTMVLLSTRGGGCGVVAVVTIVG